MSIVSILAKSVYILVIWSTCCRFEKRKAGITRCRVRGGPRSVPARATTAQSRSFVSNPPAFHFHVLICLILLNYTSFSTRTRFGILRGYIYVSFNLVTLLLVWFGCFSCLILVHSGVIYPDSALIHWILGTFVYIWLLRSVFFGFRPHSRLR